MPVPPPPPDATIAQTSVETAIVREVNRVRGLHGLHVVRANRRLARVARRHSVAMLRLGALTHAPALRARMAGAGGRRFSETLAWTNRGGARTVVTMWLQSPGHRAVLLDGGLRRVGVGRVPGSMAGQRGWAVTADFSS